MKKRRIKHPERRDEFGRLLRADGQVDRRRPPKESQFKPGQSGHPLGRPKGRKNTSTLVVSLMDSKVSMRIRGKDRKVSVREAVLTRYAEEALKGNQKAAAFLFQYYDAYNNSEQVSGVSADQDQAVIDFFFETFGKPKKEPRK